jgi:murein L,D-transpeptidase YafK
MKKTVEMQLNTYGGKVAARLKPYFEKQNLSYPPKQLAFIGLKNEKVLEVFASGNDGHFKFIRSYPILAASGKLGPKLRQGDMQVPEGLYRIDILNPNSLYHLSLRVNYPNQFDKAQAAREGRDDLGGDIMIHGNRVSIGCIAVGDSASEDLFVLAALVGLPNIQVILSPVDFRINPTMATSSQLSEFTKQLYPMIRHELVKFSKAEDLKTETESLDTKVSSKFKSK